MLLIPFSLSCSLFSEFQSCQLCLAFKGDGLCSFSIQRGSSSLSKNNMRSSAYGQSHSPVLWSSLPSAAQNNICCAPFLKHSLVLTSTIRHSTLSFSVFHLQFHSYYYVFPPRLLQGKYTYTKLSRLFSSLTLIRSYVSVCYCLNACGHFRLRWTCCFPG